MKNWKNVRTMPYDERVFALATRDGASEGNSQEVIAMRRKNKITGSDEFYVMGAGGDLHQLDTCIVLRWK